MAQNGRFELSLKVLVVLAAEPDRMRTSASLAKELAESAVMIRRCFLLLRKRGLIEQRKGPNGGAKLKLPAKQIGLGDVYAASEQNWLVIDDPATAPLLKRAREDGIRAMNETTLAQILKRLKKNSSVKRVSDVKAKDKFISSAQKSA
jgi:DNA-binding IscR family transcriptional regulator